MSESPATQKRDLVDLTDASLSDLDDAHLADTVLGNALRQVEQSTLEPAEPVAGFQSTI